MPFAKAFQTGTTLPRYSYIVILHSPIGRKWTSIGGLETTGRALSDPMLLEDGFGLMQMFVLGAIFWSPAFGAVYMDMRVGDAARRNSGDIRGQACRSHVLA